MRAGSVNYTTTKEVSRFGCKAVCRHFMVVLIMDVEGTRSTRSLLPALLLMRSSESKDPARYLEVVQPQTERGQLSSGNSSRAICQQNSTQGLRRFRWDLQWDQPNRWQTWKAIEIRKKNCLQESSITCRGRPKNVILKAFHFISTQRVTSMAFSINGGRRTHLKRWA